MPYGAGPNAHGLAAVPTEPRANGAAAKRSGSATTAKVTAGTRDHAVEAFRTSRDEFEQLDPFKGGGQAKAKSFSDDMGGTISAWLLSLGGDRKLTRPYLQNPWVFACVQANARAMASLPVQFMQGKGDKAEAIDDDAHPLVALFDAPNPLQSQAKFLKQLTNYHLLWGETYLLMFKREEIPASGGKPARVEYRPVRALEGSGMTAKVETPDEVWPVAGHLVQEVIDKAKGPLPYAYRVHTGETTEEYSAEAVVHLADANPHSVLRGVGPMTAALRDAAKGYQVDRYDDALLKNGGTPGGVLSLEGAVPDGELRAIRESWREAHERPDQHRKTAVLPHGTSYTPHGFTPHDMEFSQLREWIRQTIMAVFGVTKPILGITDDVNMSNAREAYRVFWETTIVPLVAFFEDELNFKLVRRLAEFAGKGLRFTLDLTDVAALREDIDATVERTIKLYRDGHRTFTEAAKLAGWDLGQQELAGADERWVPGNLLPADMAATMPAMAPVTPPAASDEPDDAEPADAPEPQDAPAQSPNNAQGEEAANPKATLNGAQIASLLEIITLVTSGSLTVETAVQVIVAAFPFDEARAREILADVDPGSAPAPAPPGAPGGDDEDEGEPTEPESTEPDSDDAGEAAADDDDTSRANRALSRFLVLNARDVAESTDEREALLDAYWRAQDAVLREREGDMARGVFGVFRGLLDEYDARLREIAREARSLPNATTRYIPSEAELERLLDINFDAWDAAMADEAAEHIVGTITAAAEQLQFEIGGGVATVIPATDPEVLNFLGAKRVQIVEGWNTNLAQSLQRKMVAVLADAPANVTSLAKAIEEVLDELLDEVETMRGFAGRRAIMIARTEVTSAASFARTTQMGRDGIERHTWLSSRDASTRDEHDDLDGQTADVGAVFVGASGTSYNLRFPGDPNGKAEHVIQCRCTTIPELPERAVPPLWDYIPSTTT